MSKFPYEYTEMNKHIFRIQTIFKTNYIGYKILDIWIQTILSVLFQWTLGDESLSRVTQRQESMY